MGWRGVSNFYIGTNIFQCLKIFLLKPNFLEKLNEKYVEASQDTVDSTLFKLRSMELGWGHNTTTFF